MSKGTKGKGMVVLGLDLGPNCVIRAQKSSTRFDYG